MNNEKLTEEQLEKIRTYTGPDFDEGRLFTFSLILCDNEVDRDKEKFTVPALEKLKELFVGKTGIFDHVPSAKNQTARIFETELVTDSERTTLDGEPYTFIKARAYMLKNDENMPTVEKIEAGINKETSVGCSLARVSCSVCGEDVRGGECYHQKGKEYDGRLCFHLLEEPTDAYEWSFVAVPAQKNAGVIKSFKFDDADSEKKVLLEYREDLRNGVIKNFAVLLPQVSADMLTEVCTCLPLKALKNLKITLDGAVKENFEAPQTALASPIQTGANEGFII